MVQHDQNYVQFSPNNAQQFTKHAQCITLGLFCNTKGLTMKTELISTRIDHDMKIEFTHVCEDIGLSPSQAIKLFAKAVINYGGIPFELKGKQPNKTSLQAMLELEQGKGLKATTASELFNELGVKISDV